jgi:hypothetical protein
MGEWRQRREGRKGRKEGRGKGVKRRGEREGREGGEREVGGSERGREEEGGVKYLQFIELSCELHRVSLHSQRSG